MKKRLSVLVAIILLFSSSYSSLAMSRVENTFFDPMVQLEASESGMTYSAVMQERAIERKANEQAINSFDNKAGANSVSNDGRYVSSNVKLIQQTKSYNCGPTAALQVLYGCNCQSKVRGTNDSEKISKLMSESGTNSDGTIVYKLKNTLNSYSSMNYTYTAGKNLNINTLREKINNSLFYNSAPILHAKTEKISYYHGHKSGHYIAISQLDLVNNIVRVRDCNYNNQYYGTYDISLKEVYESITPANETRYLIHLNY